MICAHCSAENVGGAPDTVSAIPVETHAVPSLVETVAADPALTVPTPGRVAMSCTGVSGGTDTR